MSRRRFRYDPELKQVVEVGADWTDATTRAQTTTEELVYGGAVATDGTPLNSRKKHADYLKKHGLAMSSDFGPGFKESLKREAAAKDRAQTAERKQQVARSMEVVARRNRR